MGNMYLIWASPSEWRGASCRSAELVSLQKKWSFAAHFGTATVFLFFFVFGPATVVEFRVECILEKRFNCETNTKNWGLGCRRTRFPLKWSLVWGLCGLSWKVMQPTLPEMVVYKWMFFSEMIFFQARNRFRRMLVTQKTWCILCKRFDKSSYKGRVQNRL